MAARKILYGQYAGFVTRAAAFITDLIVIALTASVSTAITRLVLDSFRIGTLTNNLTLFALVGFHLVFAFVYFVGLWVLVGQTLGMRLTGLRIVRTNGAPIGVGRAILRWIGYFFSAILFLGFLWVLLDSRRQGLHDKIAGTYVIYAWDARSANLSALTRTFRAGSSLPPSQNLK